MGKYGSFCTFSFTYAEMSAMVTRMRMIVFPNKHGGGEEQGGGERGGQQKAAAAPSELEQKKRTQRRSLPIRSETKPRYSDPTTQTSIRPVLLCQFIAPFCAFCCESAQSDSCCLGATSQTRWRTRPCHSVTRPAQ